MGGEQRAAENREEAKEYSIVVLEPFVVSIPVPCDEKQAQESAGEPASEKRFSVKHHTIRGKRLSEDLQRHCEEALKHALPKQLQQRKQSLEISFEKPRTFVREQPNLLRILRKRTNDFELH